jgi:crossover junction endodeoxyribonuclease RuvC
MSVRVIGIDPGTIRTGWGIVEAEGSRLKYVGAGTIHAPDKHPLEARLRILFEGLVEVFAAHSPSAVAVEEVYVGKHVSAALALGHARGIALLAASQRDVVVHSYAASVVKRAVVGRGGADKVQVAQLVGAVLGLRELPGIDATDALAIAITHAQTLRLRELDLLGPRKGSRR